MTGDDRGDDRHRPTELAYGDHPAQYVELWQPAGSAIGTALLVHGGYWRSRWALDLMDPMAEHLSRRGWRVVNAEYRRVEPDSTDGVWPAMAADLRSVLDIAIGAGVDDTTGDGRDTVVVGHSAGGQLALWVAADRVAVARADTGERRGDSDRVGVAGVVALAPVADLVVADRLGLSDGAAALLLGGGAAEVPDRYGEASPIARVPIGVAQLVVHGTADDAVPIELAQSYAQAASAAGDDVELHTPPDVDHFDIIDPDHALWQVVDATIERWVGAPR